MWHFICKIMGAFFWLHQQCLLNISGAGIIPDGSWSTVCSASYQIQVGYIQHKFLTHYNGVCPLIYFQFLIRV